MPTTVTISIMTFREELEGWDVYCSPYAGQWVPINDPNATEAQLATWIEEAYARAAAEAAAPAKKSK